MASIITVSGTEQKSIRKRMKKLRKTKKQTAANLVPRVVALEKDKREREPKFSDTQIVLDTNIPNAWAFTDLTDGIGQGSGANARTGVKISADSIQGRLTIRAGDAVNRVRLVLYSLETSAGFGDLFEVNNEFHSPYKMNADTKWKRYFDKSFMMVQSADSELQYLEFYIPLKGLQIVYAGAGAASPIRNKLQLAFISGSAGTPHPLLNGYMRLKYHDN